MGSFINSIAADYCTGLDSISSAPTFLPKQENLMNFDDGEWEDTSDYEQSYTQCGLSLRDQKTDWQQVSWIPATHAYINNVIHMSGAAWKVAWVGLTKKGSQLPNSDRPNKRGAQRP
jgi:hypothetical protein